MPAAVKTKKRCCKSGPRCKSCPVVWKRLEAAGLAERDGKRRFAPTEGKVPKPAMRVARAR